MRIIKRQHEKGFALLLSLLALTLLTAIALGMVYMSSTGITINSNFKGEETAYFAARAGAEEVRDRMLIPNANTISGLLPAALPSTGGGVLYVLQTGVTTANVTTGLGTNLLADDELCHDFNFGGMNQFPANVRCNNLPAGSSWYQTTASVAPYPLEYKWVRVTLKSNNSTAYPVNGVPTNSTQVCWNGASEVTLNAASCAAMTPAADPVYMLTALAVTPSGARRIVQMEVAQTPTSGQPGGMYATGNGCAALTIGGGAGTGSFNSASEPTPTNPPSNQVNANGNIGANGNVSVNGTSASINGSIATDLTAAVGSCPPDGISKSGNPVMGAPVQLSAPYTPPVPATPNPLPPTSTYSIHGTVTLAPGSYGNVSAVGGSTVTLTGGTTANPAVYTLNSLSLAGNSTITITGPVVINLAGVGQTNVLDMTGGGFTNTTNVPSNFQINYGGSGSIVMAGGSQAYGILNAPNAAISFHGGSNFYGQVLGGTIDDHGGTNFYWDQAANIPPQNNNSYYEISMRELSY
jgi:hypothetical protein